MARHFLLVILGAAALTGCSSNKGNLFEVTRSACPAVAVLQHADNVTTFSPIESRNADAIDVTAAITDVRGTCVEAGDQLVTSVTFNVVAQRRNTQGPREVTLPFFTSVVQGGDKLVAKQLGSVTLRFTDGQARTQAAAAAQARVSRAAATLASDIRERITRKRKPGDPDAAIDPMADPGVRAAVRAASFEVLVGFQIDASALAYNIGK